MLGWPITHNDRHTIVVATDSRLMRAQNSLTVSGNTLVWTTCVSYANPLGRLLWAPARTVHQWLVPRTLARAIRRNHVSTR